jgi:GxxExxY protein
VALVFKARLESAEVAEDRAAPQPRRLDRLTEQIIGAPIEVHRQLGPGLTESAYEECLCYELSQLGLPFQRQVHLPISYKGIKLDCGYKMDLVVDDSVVLELKTGDRLLPLHAAQLLTYLKLSRKTIGLLLNFNEPVVSAVK